MTEVGIESSLMATHSSTLAWKIPWMEERGRLQSMSCKELDTTERLHFHFSLSLTGEGNDNPLQGSCPENPRDGGEPGGLPSMGSHRVGHDCRDLAAAVMATHSSPLAWKIPWTEERGRLYSPRGRKESDTTERLHFTLQLHRPDSWPLHYKILTVGLK